MAARATDTPNPISNVRKELGKSLRVAAAEMDIHHQALYLNECGVYPHILPRVATWMREQGADMEAADQAYLLYLKEHRQSEAEAYNFASWTIERLGAPDGNPVVELRKLLELSRMAFCKKFCIDPAVMYTSETRGKSTAVDFPAKLSAILLEMHMPYTVVRELESRYRDWFNG